MHETRIRNIFSRIVRQSRIVFTVLLATAILPCLVAPALAQNSGDGAKPQAPETSLPDRVFLCVYADHLEDAATQWAAYRNATGWDAEAVPVSSIIGEQKSRAWMWTADLDQKTNNDVAREIRDYLRNYLHSERELRQVKGGWFAVMLLGDVNAPKENINEHYVIPSFYKEKPDDPTLRSFWERDDFVTDQPYQYGNDDDELPDFILGRVPAQTNDQALSLLSKVRAYESSPAPGAWRKRITYLASEGRFGAMDRMLEKMFIAMVESVVPYDYDISMTYANPTSPYCAPPSQFGDYVMRRINDGALLVNYIGHGAPNSLDVLDWRGQSYGICTIDQAVSQLDIDPHESPILLIVACSTGMYDRPDGRRSLSETMLFHPNGPVAILSGSRITHPYPNAMYQKEVTAQLCLQKRPTVGGVDLVATRRLMDLRDETDEQMERLAVLAALQQQWKTEPSNLRYLHAMLYNLLGDPATRIPYPEGQFENVQLDATTGVVTGRVTNVDASARLVVVTIESPRSYIPHESELLPVQGRDDPDLETKAAHNYDIANNLVMARYVATVDAEDGTFRIELADWPIANPPPNAPNLWLKLACFASHQGSEIVDDDEPAGALEATASLKIALD